MDCPCPAMAFVQGRQQTRQFFSCIVPPQSHAGAERVRSVPSSSFTGLNEKSVVHIAGAAELRRSRTSAEGRRLQGKFVRKEYESDGLLPSTCNDDATDREDTSLVRRLERTEAGSRRIAEKIIELDDTFSHSNWADLPNNNSGCHSESLEVSKADSEEGVDGKSLAEATRPGLQENSTWSRHEFLERPGRKSSAAGAAPWESLKSEGEAQDLALEKKRKKWPKLEARNLHRGREGPESFRLADDNTGLAGRLQLEVLAAKSDEELVAMMDSNLEDMASVNLLILLEACVKNEQPSKIFEIVKWAKKRLRRTIGSHTLTKLIALAGRSKDARLAQQIFDFMGELDLPRDVFTYNALMNAYGKVEMFDKATAIMEDLTSGRVGCHPDAFSFSSAINHSVKAGRYTRVVSFFETMKANNYVPDIVTYSAVAYAIGRLGRPADAEALVEEMAEHGLTADTSLYSVLVYGYGKMKQFKEVERVLKKMEMAGCAPSMTTFTSLMDIYGKAGDLQKVEEFHAAMLRRGLKPSVASYNCLISCYARNGEFAKAEAVISQMPASCPPSNRTFTDLMDSYAKAGLPDMAQKVFVEMKRRQIEPNDYSFTILVDMWVKLGRVARAEEVIRDMEAAGVYPVEAYHALIVGYMKSGEVGAAERVLDWIEMKQLPVCTWTYNILIRAYGERGILSKMKALWTRMLGAGLVPNELTWMAMVHAYEKCQQMHGAIAVMKRMVEGGWEEKLEDPLRVYNVMLATYSRCRMLTEAEELFAKMKEKGQRIRPDRVSYNTLLHAYGKANELDKMEALFREMRAKGNVANEVSYSCVVSAFARARNFKRALVWLECMVAAGVQPNEFTFHSLIGAYSKAGFYKKAEVWFNRMKAAGFRPSETSYSARIAGYLLAGRFREAEKLVVEMEREDLKPQQSLLKWLSDVKRGKVWGLKGVVKVVNGAEVIHRQKKRKGMQRDRWEKEKEGMQGSLEGEPHSMDGLLEQGQSENEVSVGSDGNDHGRRTLWRHLASDSATSRLASQNQASVQEAEGEGEHNEGRITLVGDGGEVWRQEYRADTMRPSMESVCERQPDGEDNPKASEPGLDLRRPFSVWETASEGEHRQGGELSEDTKREGQMVSAKVMPQESFDKTRISNDYLIDTWKRSKEVEANLIHANMQRRLETEERSTESSSHFEEVKGAEKYAPLNESTMKRPVQRAESRSAGWLGGDWKPVQRVAKISHDTETDDLSVKYAGERSGRGRVSRRNEEGKGGVKESVLGVDVEILELAGITSEYLRLEGALGFRKGRDPPRKR